MIGKWYVVDYMESGHREYVGSLEELAKLVGLSMTSAKTYLYRGVGGTPRQAMHPTTKKVELVTFGAVDMSEPLPDALKDHIAATV